MPVHGRQWTQRSQAGTILRSINDIVVGDDLR
jgi:hypothetical protein